MSTQHNKNQDKSHASRPHTPNTIVIGDNPMKCTVKVIGNENRNSENLNL